MERFLIQLKRTPLGEGIVHHQKIPARPALWDQLSFSLPAIINEGLEQKGITAFYRHQVEALEAVHRGEHTIVATPTASGKTLVYALTCFKNLLEDQSSKSLLLFPIKALEQDQRKVMEEWAPIFPQFPGGLTAIYDGDTPPSDRKKIRQKPPPIIISNPDMLHLGLLPFHESWKEFFKNLKLVVIDEAHTYKGILGSHVVQIIRRLRRICGLYGSAPQFVLSSATIARPDDFSRALAGLTFTVVQDSGFPSPAKHFLFINPDISPAVVGSRLFSHCLARGKKTILFSQGRRQTELIHKWVAQMAPALKDKISSYRAGFLPEERRIIERQLSSGELLGVISTSALELGIDIGSLDVCILVGYPGSIINTWQRGGRVGRAQQESAIFFVAQPDALDQYFIRHPENFFGRGFEAAVVDPGNSPILKAHLVCATAELPLSQDDPLFTRQRCAPELAALEKEGRLLRNAAGDGWISLRKNPHREVNIRSVGESYTIMEGRKGKVIGTVDGVRAFRECHPGAVYLHRAIQFLVEDLDLFEKNIYVKPREVNYYTRILAQKETEIIEKEKVRPVGNFLINFGRVLVTETFTSYEKRAIYGQELLGTYPLELPSVTFETRGLWIEVEEALQEQLKASHFQVMGSLHALEHGAISMFPLYALCDRGDIGGICYVRHPQVEKGAIFIYDGVPGGVGLAERGFEIIEDLLQRTSDLITECDCEEGCPSCIHSPQCGSGNKPLDKAGARYLTQLLLGQVDLRQPCAPLTPEALITVSEPAAGRAEPMWRIGVFDLETQRLAEEVGGWGNTHLMRLSVGVVYDSLEERFFDYRENQVNALIEHLKKCDLLIGFNVKRFDYSVLKAYSTFNFKELPTLDLLEDIHQCLGFRLSLDHLARKTLGKEKSGDGFLAVRYFREGKFRELTDYCRQDVEITRLLFDFGRREGHLLFETKDGQGVRLPVDWGPERIKSLVKAA
ncbi:MAG: DUF1998 domain-containing protein [Deltaproteobacteria bacterium]|nr:DUF1998 domain-containing protein [Deltaproteobacteria bacterium]